MDAERKEMSRAANKDAVVKAWVSTPYLSHPPADVLRPGR